MSGGPLKPGAITWRDGNTPHSPLFDDIYFTPDDGLAESRHVFLGGIGAPDVWRDWRICRLGETGFGTGLNFLATWQAWRRTAATDAQLEYFAIEGYPLAADDARRALSGFPELGGEMEALLAAWPLAHPGFHRLSLEGGRVRLTLALGPVEDMLAAARFQADAWYLDGFAPAANPEMWSPAVLNHVARLSRPGARIATFTAAGAVRRGLETAGFVTEKSPGFGQKKERIVGHKRGGAGAEPKLGKDARIAVIGAGIAGACTAAALAARGLAPVVIDRHGMAAREASGNPAGLLHPPLRAAADPYADFHETAFLHALRYYDGPLADAWLEPRGLLVLPRDNADCDRHAAAARRLDWPQDLLRAVTATEAAEISGLATAQRGLYFASAGMLDPVRLSARLLAGIDIAATEVGELRQGDNDWTIIDRAGREVMACDAVIVAGGADSAALLPEGSSPDAGLYRGQVTYLDPDALPRTPRCAISCGHYLTPPVSVDGADRLVTGATFDHWPADDANWPTPRAEDDRRNINAMAKLVDEFESAQTEAAGGRAGLRLAMLDHMPAVGPAFDHDRLRDAVWQTRGKPGASEFSPGSDIPGLHMLAGLGARGLLTAPLAAEILADMVTGGIPAVGTDLLDHLLPCRFAARQLRRG